MNKTLISERFSKAVGTYTVEATAQKEIACHMMELLNRHLPHFNPKVIAEFGCGTGNFSRLLYNRYLPESFLINDICKDMACSCDDLLKKGVVFEAGDAEHFGFPHHCNLLTSCSTIQWFSSPAHFFERCGSFITSDGYLAFSTFGPNNFKEIKATTGSGLNYLSQSELIEALIPYYDIVHIEDEHIVQYYQHPIEVLKHLKQTGVTGIQSYQWTRGKLSEFCNKYQLNYTDRQGVTLTYHPVYVIAKKKKS